MEKIKSTFVDINEKDITKSSDYEEILKDSKILNIKCFKWLHSNNKRKYDEMFDYDTDTFKLSEYNVKTGGTIIDNFKNLKFIENSLLDKNDEEDSDLKLSFKNITTSEHFNSNRNFLKENIVVHSNFKNKFTKEFIISYNKYTYVVCKYLKDDSNLNIITIGSLLKLGKFVLKILIVKIDDDLKFPKNLQNSLLNDLTISESEEEKAFNSLYASKYHEFLPNLRKTSFTTETCRICFKETNDSTGFDRFISVCNCKGSLKYLHPYCLSKWIKSKCDIEFNYLNPNFFKIRIKKFKCEICRKKFPLVVRDTKEEFYYLIDFLKMKNNYIVMQSFLIIDEDTIENIKDEKNSGNTNTDDIFSEFLYIELSNFYKKNIIIGRDKKSDVILDDVSVSRRHCQLFIDRDRGNYLRVKDLGSKFGTLISMKDDIILDELNPEVSLQKGNTVYNFKIKNLFLK
jgi:hypothetical protein